MLATDNEILFQELVRTAAVGSTSTKTLYAGEGVLADITVTTAKERLKRLRKQRNIFGIIAVLCLIAVAVSVFEQWPYEPALAVMLAVTGIFIVFLMKANDAKG